MNRIAALLAALYLAAASAAALAQEAAAARPDALVEAVTSEVVSVLKQDRAAGRQTRLAELIELKVLPLFDFQRMTSIAMGRHWRDASPEQKVALAAAFKRLLVRTYASALAEYKDQEIVYRPLRAAAGESEVSVVSLVRRPGAEALSIDYAMERGASGWQVFDVKIAGVSLVLSYRQSFAAVIRERGIDGLIADLEAKTVAASAGR